MSNVSIAINQEAAPFSAAHQRVRSSQRNQFDAVMRVCDADLMRTTINLDEHIVRALRQIAHERGQSMGDVASELIGKGLRARDEFRVESVLPVFEVHEKAPPITGEDVRAAESSY